MARNGGLSASFTNHRKGLYPHDLVERPGNKVRAKDREKDFQNLQN
jgi:hypothetical protein